jgi:hypothetical protein
VEEKTFLDISRDVRRGHRSRASLPGGLPEAAGPPAALDTTVDMLDAQPALHQRRLRHLLRQRALLAAWLLDRHEALDRRERERQEAQIQSQPAPRG